MSLAFDDIPQLVEGLDARSLPLSAVEGFVLSRVDGVSTAKEIADSTGIGEEIALTALQRLLGLGAIRVQAAVPPSPPHAPAAPEQPSKRFGKPETMVAQPQRIRTVPPPSGTPRRLYDPAELEEDVGLDDARKRRILDVFYKLGACDFYELLELGRDATKDEIREAYFALSKEFHPDTAYGKDLGSYKSKMEKIFTAATGAYDTLSRRARRTEYDATLPPPHPDDANWRDRRRRPGSSAVFSGPGSASGGGAPASDSRPKRRSVPPPTKAGVTPPTPVSPAAAAAPSAPVAPRAPVAPSAPVGAASAAGRPAAQPPPSPTPASPAIPRPPSLPEPPPSPVPAHSSAPPPTPDQIKRSQELLRMRLMGGRARPDGTTTSQMDIPNPKQPVSTEASRADVLRGLAGSLRDVSNVTGSGQSLRRHLLAASDAERAGDLKGALSAIKLASALAPDDPRVSAELRRLEGIRSVEEAPMFETRALAEEQAGDWSGAALSWLRVVEGRPTDPVAARRCANALLEANLDLKKARDLAQRAVDHDPGLVDARVLLARIYVAAGMNSSARRELDAATKLDPRNEIVKNLLRQLG